MNIDGRTIKKILNMHKNRTSEADEFADMLVFGYSCKLFRDDEKAQFIEQGDHLISWHNCNDLKIDRFDIRSVLSDRKKLDEYSSSAPAKCLAPDEAEIERVCDQDRYCDLKELELSSDVQGPSNQFFYNYDSDSNNNGRKDEHETNNRIQGPIFKPENEIEAEPYEKPVSLVCPNDMLLPKTMKEHARILKTASFIKSNGTQMEILLKTKQANNPQFAFLTIGNELYPYYKNLLNCLKNGTFQDENESKALTTSVDRGPQSSIVTSEPPLTIAGKENGVERVPGSEMRPQPPLMYSNPPTLPRSLIMNDENNPFAQIMNKLSNQLQSPFLSQHKQRQQSAAGATGTAAVSAKISSNDKSLRLIAQYSDSDASDDEIADQENVAIPPDDVRLIIDKMASYVAKNGPEFEQIVRVKDDIRFSFLEKSHPFHSYYLQKLQKDSLVGKPDENLIKTLPPPPPPLPQPPAPTTKTPFVDAMLTTDQVVSSKNAGPISFSIKKITESNGTKLKSSLASPSAAAAAAAASSSSPASTKTSDIEIVDLTLDDCCTEPMELSEDVFLKLIESECEDNQIDRELQLKRKERAAAFLNRLKKTGSGHAAAAEEPAKKSNRTKTKRKDRDRDRSRDRDRDRDRHREHSDRKKDKYRDKRRDDRDRKRHKDKKS